MVVAARYVYLALAWAFVIGLVVQVFIAGLGVFAGAQNLRTHADLGWILHLAPLLILLVAVLARAGRRDARWALALAAVVFIVPILATLRGDMPVVAALHPVVAMVAFGLAAMVARNSLLVLRAPRPAAAGVASESSAAS